MRINPEKKARGMDHEWSSKAREFIRNSGFLNHGAIVTDLDGTAVYEDNGRVAIHPDVAVALKRLNDRGHPVVINTLRFPDNIIKSFGRVWASITDAPLPVVSLNGSVIGYLEDRGLEDPIFNEIEAFPLTSEDKSALLIAVERLMDEGLRNLILFYYPRDWTIGEMIWTPDPERLPHIRGKYNSASESFSSSVAKLSASLMDQDICMALLLVEEPGDRLMAYQHARPTGFVTASGVDKSHGWKQLCSKLNIDPFTCIGAGDTPMDTFLGDVGLALHVGPIDLAYRGRYATLRLEGPHTLGAFLSQLSEVDARV